MTMSWEQSLSNIGQLDSKAVQLATSRLDRLTKPKGSLGRLEEIARQMAGIQRKVPPQVCQKTVFVMAADHGVTEEGVSAYPKEVTAQMVLNFLRGGAAINVLARHANVKVVVVDMGVDYHFQSQSGMVHAKIAKGTRNFAKEPAMSKEQLSRAIQTGWDLAGKEIEGGSQLLAVGDMGIGNTTAASALTSVLCSMDPEIITGHGTGIDEDARRHKIAVIRKAIETHYPNSEDPLDVLRKLGGFEIVGMVGVILRSVQERVAVVLDGFITGSAGLVAYCLEPKVKDFLFASHLSVERGHQIQLEKIGLVPLLNLGMRLGEGTGAVLAMSLIEAACKILGEMATFDEAGVSQSSGSSLAPKI